MKYIFLDIDGVLSLFDDSMDSTKDFWIKNPWAKPLNVMYSFNTECVKIFNEILEETDAEIILSSDWKKRKTVNQLDIIFRHNNVLKSPIDFTNDYKNNYDNFEYCRAMEITHYIAENNIKDYVIIDDLNIEILLPPNIRSRFVRTNDNYGLDESGIKDKIIKILNSK